VELTLNQALAVLKQAAKSSLRSEIFLACGFQPLHLETFLKAYFSERFPGERAEVWTGLYGDLEGTLLKAVSSGATAAAVVIERSDLDPRLGLRSAGGWGLSVQQDILRSSAGRWACFLAKLADLASRMAVALVAHTAGWQMSPIEVELEKQTAGFLAEAAVIGNVSILNPSRLARLSPEGSRLDAKMELAAGFPYSLGHASALASQLVMLLYPPSPMKGLITDLDETLWSGVVGEIGVGRVSWSLAEHAQMHGLYQQELRHLSEMGVLLAIASKNEIAVVKEALLRSDLYISGDAFYPVFADWGPKSRSVAGILQEWNIGAEGVVFVDDSPLELDEVRTGFPTMTCLPFPNGSPAKVVELLEQLRDLFGKPAVFREDALRQASIRASGQFKEAARQGDSGGFGEFMKGLEGKVSFDARKDSGNKRLLELINKTNQFNLNGVRLTEGEWLRRLEDPASFVVSVSYEDKFGPLGAIGVVAGKRAAGRLEIGTWVMSCRAFSRRIEFHTLEYLFGSSGAESISLKFQPTERNQPLQEFLRQIHLAADPTEGWILQREKFAGEHELPHSVVVTEEG
jgi:FkbH-like protein